MLNTYPVLASFICALFIAVTIIIPALLRHLQKKKPNDHLFIFRLCAAHLPLHLLWLVLPLGRWQAPVYFYMVVVFTAVVLTGAAAAAALTPRSLRKGLAAVRRRGSGIWHDFMAVGRPRPGQQRSARGITYLVFACIICIGLATVADYAITWDEAVRAMNGNNIIAWYVTCFSDTTALARSTHYGGFFDVISQIAASAAVARTHENFFLARHIVNFVFGIIALIGAYRIASQLGGPRAGLAAVILLVLTPRFYGHMFNNPKDIPFAAMFALSLSYILRFYRRLPAPPWSLALKTGLAIGCTLGIRIGGGLLYGYLAVAVLCWAAVYLISGRRPRYPLISFLQGAGGGLLVIAVSWLTMMIAWPFTQTAPLTHPFAALRTMAKFPWNAAVWFRGEFVPVKELPWDYLPTWLAISLPESYLIAGAAALTAVVCFWIRFRNRPANWHPLVMAALLLFAAVFPWVYVLYKQSTIYDGLRHFLFILPIFAALGGAGWCAFWRSKLPGAIKAPLAGLMMLSLLAALLDMAALHPYQYLYFNRLGGGGFQHAAARFETDYWGNTYREAAEWVIANIQPRSRLKVSGAFSFPQWGYPFDPVKYSRRTASPHLLYFWDRPRPDGASEPVDGFDVNFHRHADIVLATRRWNLHKNYEEGRLLHTVRLLGVPLMHVIRMPRGSTVNTNAKER